MSAFSYQNGFANPTKKVDRNLFYELFDGMQTRWLVDKHREVKSDLENAERWAADSDFQQWLRREKHKDADTGSLVKQWCDSLKRRLPAIMFQASFLTTTSKKGFNGMWRKQKATCLSGLVVMDIDHVEDPRKTFGVWRETVDFDKEGIMLVYVTPGGHGLKVVFKARLEWGNLIDNQHQMAKVLTVVVDEACKDASRMAFVSKKEDILFMNEEIFDYENREYAEKYNEEYRRGNSRATPDLFDGIGDGRDGAAGHGDGQADEDKQPSAEQGTGGAEVLKYKGVEIQKIIDAWMVDKNVEPGNRNNTLLLLAKDIRYITTTNPEKLTKILQDMCPWVKQLEDDDHNTLTTVRSACDYKYYASFPKTLMAALDKVGARADNNYTSADLLPLAEWGAKIRAMGKDFPCINEIGHGLPDVAMPAALFASAAMFGTLMTRTWYHFYHRPNKERRLNYCVYIIGDPGSGKSFVGDLYDVLMAPVVASDQVGYEALNKWKREKNERNTSSKEQKKEKLEKPQAVIRIHPARTSNGVFIEDMKNAVELVGQKQMHLHLFTFDSELDNNTKLSGGGGTWIDRQVMELKAFHNEEDGQAYANSDSVMGMFNVYWNFIYTGTIKSLHNKTQGIQGVASGLTTRLAVIPMPKSGFQMIDFASVDRNDAVESVLTDWAQRLDSVNGELPLAPIVKECWEWTRDHMAIAEVNNDVADELLIKRVAYYGIAIATPFVLMRHWKEWEQNGTFSIDETDLQLCDLALDIQYYTQHYYFGEATVNYFADCERDGSKEHKRSQKSIVAYGMLPKVFTVEDVERCYEAKHKTALVIIHRLFKEGLLTKENDILYKTQSSL